MSMTYRYIDDRAVITDWEWLKKHTFKELIAELDRLNAKRDPGHETDK